MTHAAHVPADFVSTFRHRLAPLFGRKIGRQRSEQYLGGLLGGRAERRNVTSLAGTVDGATARALGWLLNKSPWPTRPVVDALQTYVGDTFGAPEGLFTLNLDSFVKRGDIGVGVEKQYVHHLGRTQNCQIGVFLAYGTEKHNALVDAALYMPHSWIDGAPRRAKAGVPESVQYQPKSALAIELLRAARAAGRLPGSWATTWHGEGFEPDLRARLDADAWQYLLSVSPDHLVFASADAADPHPIADLLPADALTVRRVWEGDARQASWLLGCTDALTGSQVAFVSNAPEGAPVEMLERILAARWESARMLAARCAGVSLDVYRVRGWDGWHRHVALALLASAFRACLPAAPAAAPAFVPDVTVTVDDVPAFREPVVLQPADDVASEETVIAADELAALYAEEADVEEPVAIAERSVATHEEPVSTMEHTPDREAEPELIPFPPVAVPTTYLLSVDLMDTDWRAVRAFQIWLVADEAGTVLESSPSRPEIERQEVGPRMEVRFQSEHSLEQILAALDEVPEIIVAELVAASGAAQEAVASGDDAAGLEDADDLLAALQEELSARTSAREAGLMPAFEGPADVIGITMDEIITRELESAPTLVPAYGANGHTNGNGAVAVASLSAPAAPPTVPPAEAPVRPVGPGQFAQPSQPAPTASAAEQAAPKPKKAEEKARPAEEQMVVLDVGEESYGIPVQRVREIVRVPPITRVPNGPAFLEGVINLCGQVIPVMDLRKHLGIPSGSETRSSRVVVSELGSHTVGLMVDAVSEVVMVATTEIEPPPTLIAGANDGQIRGVARLGDRLVLFLDPDRLLLNR